jgi:hypothetical protein
MSTPRPSRGTKPKPMSAASRPPFGTAIPAKDAGKTL